MKKAVRFTLSGTVQWVFFRQFCKEKADKLGLKGYLRNLEDGNIEVMVEGEMDKINEMYKVLKQGPPHSQIRNIKLENRKWSGEFKDFSIVKF